MSQTVVPAPLVLDNDALTSPIADAVLDRAYAGRPDVAVVDVTGPGAMACLQGVLTCDVEKPGDGGLCYGALLTPKGMIVSDLWVWREGGSAVVIVPTEGLDDLLEAFARTLPPRLARTAVRDGVAVVRVVGPHGTDALDRAGVAVPEPGRSTKAIVGDVSLTVARPAPNAPFTADLLVAAEHAPALLGRLEAAGTLVGDVAGLELARVLAGWPRLGAEIGEKTLPQEVRFDELGGVSYTKGCYTGQETVARVHFRGHPNRHLLGLIWDGVPSPSASEVFQDDQMRGRVGTMLWLEPVERWIGLALVRRDLDKERPVLAGGAEASVVHLPFRIDP